MKASQTQSKRRETTITFNKETNSIIRRIAYEHGMSFQDAAVQYMRMKED